MTAVVETSVDPRDRLRRAGFRLTNTGSLGGGYTAWCGICGEPVIRVEGWIAGRPGSGVEPMATTVVLPCLHTSEQILPGGATYWVKKQGPGCSELVP